MHTASSSIKLVENYILKTEARHFPRKHSESKESGLAYAILSWQYTLRCWNSDVIVDFWQIGLLFWDIPRGHCTEHSLKWLRFIDKYSLKWSSSGCQ